MVFQPSAAIKEAFLAKDIKCDVAEGDDSSAVITGFDLKSGDKATFHFISLSEQNDVAVRVFRFAHAEPAQRSACMEAVNKLNCQFRYTKFTLRDDGDINAELDIPQETTDLGKVAFEMLVRSLDILAQAAPILREAGAVVGEQPASPRPEAEPAPRYEAEPPKKRFGFFGGNGK